MNVGDKVKVIDIGYPANPRCGEIGVIDKISEDYIYPFTILFGDGSREILARDEVEKI